MMTDERLKEIETITDAATPGPWGITRRKTNAIRYHVGTAAYPDSLTRYAWEHMIQVDMLDDASFIALARAAVPELLAEVKRLQEMIDRMNGRGLR